MLSGEQRRRRRVRHDLGVQAGARRDVIAVDAVDVEQQFPRARDAPRGGVDVGHPLVGRAPRLPVQGPEGAGQPALVGVGDLLAADEHDAFVERRPHEVDLVVAEGLGQVEIDQLDPEVFGDGDRSHVMQLPSGSGRPVARVP